MEYREGPTGIVGCISADDFEPFCPVKSESRRILFVYIYPCRSFLESKSNQSRAITPPASLAVDKKHLNHVAVQPYETNEVIIVGQSI